MGSKCCYTVLTGNSGHQYSSLIFQIIHVFYGVDIYHNKTNIKWNGLRFGFVSTALLVGIYAFDIQQNI